MLAIRLKRVGRTNDPSFRIIVQDHRRSPKKTRGVSEYVGFYDARKGTPAINAERVLYWIGQGAQPSDTVHNLLVDAKIIKDKKVNAMNKKTKPVKEVPKEEAKKTTPAVAAVATPVAEAPAKEAKEIAETVAVAEAAIEAPVAEVKTDEKATETPAA